MTFSIEPDMTFQKVNALAGRKDASRTPGEAGEEFARLLAQDTDTRDADAEAQQTPSASGRKATGTANSTTTPLLHAEDASGELLADAAPESDKTLLTLDEPEIDVQKDLTAKAEPDKADILESADTSDTDEPEALMAQAMPQAQTELPQPADATTGKTGVLGDQAGQATAKPDTPTPNPAQAETTATPEVQSMLVTASNPEATKPSSSRPTTETQRTVAATTITSASTPGLAAAPQPTEGKPDGALKPGKPGSTAQPSSETNTPEAFATAELAASKDTSDIKHTAGASPTPDATLLASAPAAAPPSANQPAQVQQPQMTPTNALVTASPADTVKIITDTISAPDDAPDRITVQLDPPELGRVSIDFKFDSHGLQHVTVTGENPEALRQLRMMHFELTQALERSGLSSQNMTFQQQQSGQQQAHASPARSLFATQDSDSSTSALITPAVQPARPPRMAGGGLNIRL
jgi:hypothetical protein